MTRWAVGIGGLLIGLAAMAALLWGGYQVPANLLVPAIVLNLAVGWSFIGVGLVAWARRPESRAGLLMAAVGFAWFIRIVGAIDNPAAFVFGVATKTLYLAVLAHLLITFPSGRLSTPTQWILVPAGYLLTVPANLLYLAGDVCCRQNIVVIRETAPAGDNLLTGLVIAIALFGVLLLVRILRSDSIRRRGLAPVVWGGVAIIATTVIAYAAALLGLPSSAQVVLVWSTEAVLVALPLGLLLGLLRSTLDRSAVTGLLVELGAGLPSREALARTLHDPGVQVAYWLSDRQEFVDSDGQVITVEGRARTYIEREGARLGVLIHDPAIDPDLVEAVVAAAALAVQNERLHAEVKAQLVEVRQSRARIVAAADAARRQIERDLHDGAQQRLITIALTIQRARSKQDWTVLDLAATELSMALNEVRELGRGLYPVLLTDAGLGPAITSLAQRSSIPTVITEVPDVRLPAQIEHACYFVVSEALANAAKHSRAKQITVSVRATDTQVLVEIADDGVGGADPAGSGLRGLDDRVAALGGRLAVTSPAGQGTLIRAEIRTGCTGTD